MDEEPCFGLEQEYFMIDPQTMKPLGFPDNNEIALQGQYYCSVGANNSFGNCDPYLVTSKNFETTMKISA